MSANCVHFDICLNSVHQIAHTVTPHAGRYGVSGVGRGFESWSAEFGGKVG